jgi:hypothetical protein
MRLGVFGYFWGLKVGVCHGLKRVTIGHGTRRAVASLVIRRDCRTGVPASGLSGGGMSPATRIERQAITHLEKSGKLSRSFPD